MDGTDIKSMPMSYSDHAGRDTGKGEPLDLGNISIGPVTDYGAALSGTQVLQDLLAKEPVNTDTLSDGSVVDCGDDFGMGDAHDVAKSPSTEISPMSDSPEEGSVVLTFKTSQPSLASSLDQKTLSWASFAIVVASHAGSTNCCFTDICDAIPLSQTDDFNLASSLMSSSQLNIEFDWKSDVQELLQVVQAHSVTSKGNGLQCLIKNLALKWLGGDVIDHEKGACTDCQIDCSVLEDEIHLTFTIDSALVDVESVKYMFWQYETTLHRLSSLSKEKGRPASDFQVANMQDLCKLWNWNAVVPLKVESLIHDRFALVVQRQPSLLAVSAHDGELTYSELAELSTKLALRLVSYGVQNSIVPVHIEKSVWVPVAQMAIMKAGAAAVLLDTSLPTERLRTIIQQVDPRLVLTSASSQAVTRRLSEKPSIVLDQTMFEQLPTSDTPLSLPVISPSARLYIVFTSGSTGTPKGATITHANFASAIEHQQNTLMFKTGQRVFDFASYAFDVAWSNFLHTITAGGCLCIPSDAERKQDIPGALHKYKAEYVHLTPSVAWFAPEDMPESVKIMHFSGEELKASIVQAFYRRACIINTYGPAECSVTSTMHKIQASSSQDPPIGRGLGCCTWAVSLDGTGLVPVGSIGELWIEGPIVGQGYLKDPAKTNATFVEDPEWLTRYPFHSSKPNRTGRLYRTGDLVRVNDDDGSLSFVGRKDSQVKIRGQRVELADIEHHMRQNLADDLKMSLKVAAEVMVPPGSKHPVLVAIMSPQEDKPRSVFLDMVRKAALHWDHTLSEVLPIYMVPSAYIPMEIIPMTPTGKTDRRQLRNLAADIFWDHAALEAGTEFALPSSEIEQQMLKVWSSVLNLPEVRISTNAAFTRLGGDSITAMQIVSRCRAQNIFFTVGDVLRLRSIREIARQSNNCQVADQPKIREDDPDGYYWMLSPVQQLFFAAHPNGINHYTQSFLLRVTSHITLEALSDAMKAVVQRHGMLRARFRRMEGSNNWEQTVVTPDRSSFAVEEHMYHSSDMFQDAIQTRQSSLDIRWGPVFAADLFSSDGEDQSLLLSAHHIIIDLVSWRVIWHDLSRCLSETGTLQLHRPPISFQAWCRLQYEEAQSLEPAQVLPHTVMASQLDYWGIETGDNSYSQSDHHERVLDADTTNLLLGRSNENLQTETLDILLGALVQSFREAFVDRQAPAVYLEGHGREPLNGFDIDIAETVGWFTTLHPVPVPGQVTDSVSDAIRFAKDARALVPGKGRPYIASYYHTKAGQEAFAHHQNVELLMNYRGVFQQLESAGALLQREDRAERAVSIQEFGSHYQRMALIEINVVIEYGCTRIATTTDRRMKHRDRLEHWLDLFPKTVERASRELLQIQPQKTLSDFPLLSISYASLDILLAATHAEAATGTEIVDIYPCTPMQEGIILSEKKGVASYRNSWVWLCFTSETSDTIIYPEQVKAAWEDVVRRHVVFATIFATHPDTGRPLQIVFDKSIPNCHIVEAASTQSATEHLLEMEAGATTIGRPDYSITICRDAMGDIACRLDMTHALIDASSIPVLLKDLANTYAGDASLRRSSPPLFREVVAFIQSSASSASRLDYWKLHLDSATPCRLLGDLQSVQSDRECSDMYGMIPLTETSTARIAAYCRKQDTTRAVLLQLAWALVLAQFTGKKDVCFGYVCSGRDTPVKDIESVVGPLISMLVARIDLDVSDIRTALKGTSEQSIEHLAHQHASLAEIQHALGLKEPLFNTAMTIREAHRYGNNDGLRLEEIREVDPHEVRRTPHQHQIWGTQAPANFNGGQSQAALCV